MLQSHPQNKANREVQAKEEAIIGRCKDEDRQWAKIINRTNQKFHQAIDDTKAKRNKNAEPDLRDAGWMTDALKVADGIIAEGEGDLTKMGEFEDVEFKVGRRKNNECTADSRWTLYSDRLMSPCSTRGRLNGSSTASSRHSLPTYADGNGTERRRQYRQAKAMVRTQSPCWQLQPRLPLRRPTPLARRPKARKTLCSCSAHWRLQILRRKTTRLSPPRRASHPCRPLRPSRQAVG